MPETHKSIVIEYFHAFLPVGHRLQFPVEPGKAVSLSEAVTEAHVSVSAINERACEAFSQALSCGGDGGELNSPSKRANQGMYYKLSRCFSFRRILPSTGLPYAGPLVLADD